MMIGALTFLLVSQIDLSADAVLTTRALARGDVLAASDLSGAQHDIAPFVGMAARRPLPEGRKIRALDVEEPVAVMRQDTVRVLFQRGGLKLETQGRALKKWAHRGYGFDLS